MKKIIAAIMIAVSCPFANGQDFVPAKVEISSEKVRLATGEVLYVHKVLKGQTLYSISKTYGVDMKSIIERNPDAEKNLRTGDILYIPIKKESALQNSSQTSRNIGSIQNNVQDNARSNTVKEDNGSISGGITVRINREDNIKEAEKRYARHKVKWYETIEDIATKYDTSVEAIVHLNKLSSPKVKKRDILLIPDRDYEIRNVYEVKSNDRIVGALKEETGKENDSGRDVIAATEINAAPEKYDDRRNRYNEDWQSFGSSFVLKRNYSYDRRTLFKISIILPLNAAYGREKANVNYMDFYAGSLAAINEMKEKGMRLSIETIDLSNYGNSIDKVISSGRLENSSLIIGPVTEKDLSGMISYVDSREIPLVSPMDHNAGKLVPYSEYFIQAAPENNASRSRLMHKLSSSENPLLVIYEKYRKNGNEVTEMLRTLQQYDIRYKEVGYDILEGRTITSEIKNNLENDVCNDVLIISENQAFVSDAIRNLELARLSGYDIRLFGLPKWKSFESIDLNLYHQMRLHLYVPYNVDYSDDRVNGFLLAYRALFHAEPTAYAFQGYDISSYFLELIFRYGNKFMHRLEQSPENMLQSGMQFRKDGYDGGYRNMSSKEIIYEKDYSISEN